jgi:hypothetical protein
MDRYARRQHFERLCSLRDAYGRRDALDTMAIISIEDVIAYAIDLLDQAVAVGGDGASTGDSAADLDR